MPKISALNPFVGPFSFSDEFPVNNNGATVRGNLQQLRDFFGVGTNIIPVGTYPSSDQGNPLYGKNGDLILVLDTNNLYRKVNNAFPAVNAPTAVLQGTKVADNVISTTTSWSSFKIDQYIRGGVAASIAFRTGDTVKTLAFFSRILIESLTIVRGTNSFQLRLILPDGTVAASGTSIGAISVAIGALSNAQVANGYEIEITYTGSQAFTSALFKALPA
jgi:hypothetical protein